MSWSGLVQVTTKAACFGLVVREGTVVETAPIARQSSLGLPIQQVADYWRWRGAHVQVVSTGEVSD